MELIKKILAPTDFSDLSARGVRYACQLAKDVGAELIIFNVVLLDETNVVDKHEVERHKKRLDEFIAEKSLAPAPV
jgi:nucleotide-binding universal stress UspA family protein